MRNISALSRIVVAVIVIILIIVAGVGAYLATSKNTTSSIQTSSSSSSVTSSTQTTSSILSTVSTSSASNVAVPSLLTWETTNTPSFLDPDVSYTSFDYNVLQNIYEPLLWYNRSSSTQVIPWLAQNFSVSTNMKSYSFVLRSGIQFSDGEALNSTAVYFSLYRLLIEDGSTPEGHGAQASWILQQLLNTSLSSNLCCSQLYDSNYVNDVLAQNFVEITGPLTFTINIQHSNAAFPYLLANVWADIIAPSYVMQQDVNLWAQQSNGYSLPYSALSGNLIQQISQYFQDEVATCNSGVTPKGCGATYLDGSYNGSLGGTGPYILKSFGQTTNDFVLQANSNYWGGPYQFMDGKAVTPQIKTIDINYVPSITSREIDLQNAVDSGQAMTVDITSDHIYDIAQRSAWLTTGVLNSTIRGVDIYGPYSQFATYFYPFDTNVTDPSTGLPYTFQPFSDIRFRLAFADSVNMTSINQNINNNLGQLANNLMPPGLPPAGSYNSSISPMYSYNLSAVQNLLLQAMFQPITSFTFYNGTAAPNGYFNNTFGCTALNSKGICSNPVHQSITLDYDTGDTVAEAVLNQIASVINNVSATYNMGLSVSLAPYPFGTYISSLISGYFYFYWAAIFSDYPWAIDFLGPVYATAFVVSDGWNLPTMMTLYQQAVNASESGNIAEIVSVSDTMNQLANKEVMYLWAYYPENFQPMTSNVQGVSFNPSLSGTIQYFANLT